MKSLLKTELIMENIRITIPALKESFQSSKKDNDFIIPSSPSHPSLTGTQNNSSLNTASPTSTNSSVDSCNSSSNDFSLNEANKSIFIINRNFLNNEQKNDNIFLGNKRKIQFNVKKIDKKSPFLITTNKNSSNTQKVNNTTESNLLSKETEKKELLEKPLPKKIKPHLFNTFNYNHFENLIKKNFNKGRWSSDEHLKFLRAYVNFGKKYNQSQKYIGSRNSMQIRSHAQKFFLKLKTLKNDKFDFSNDNIKNLSNVFEIIKANNETNIENNEYIVNTLIELCKNNQKNELNSSEGDIRIIINKKEGEKIFNDLLLNKEKSLKKDIFDEPLEEINNDNNMITLNEQNNENLNRKSDFVFKEQNDCNKCGNININFNQNFKFDNDYIFLSGDSDIFSKEEISSKENDFIFDKNSQSSYFKYICNYFS